MVFYQDKTLVYREKMLVHRDVWIVTHIRMPSKLFYSFHGCKDLNTCFKYCGIWHEICCIWQPFCYDVWIWHCFSVKNRRHYVFDIRSWRCFNVVQCQCVCWVLSNYQIVISRKLITPLFVIKLNTNICFKSWQLSSK